MRDLDPEHSPRTSVRVLLVDDNVVFRAALRALLGKQPDIVVVGEAGTGREAMSYAKTTRPDVVLMDLAMPGVGGVEATRRIVARRPETKVLVLTGLPEEQQVLGVLEAGASGFVEKAGPAEDVARAIRAVAQGRLFVGVDVSKFVVLQRYLRERQAGDELTPRQAVPPKTKGEGGRGATPA